MEIRLTQKPKNPTIIEGFPGFGFVSTIVTEFLVKHLDAKPIGYLWSEKLQPMVAIHDEKIINPLEIFYDKTHNIVILQAITPITGLEWNISDTLVELAKKLKAKELIGLEGVANPPKTPIANTTQAFYYCNRDARKKIFEKIKLKSFGDGVVTGVTGALLLKARDLPTSFIFVQAKSKLPDSKAAAKIIEILNKYLNLKLDYQPLLNQAREFETKLKGLATEGKKAIDQKKKKELNYFG